LHVAKKNRPSEVIFDHFGSQGGAQEPPKTDFFGLLEGCRILGRFWVEKGARVFSTGGGGVPLTKGKKAQGELGERPETQHLRNALAPSQAPARWRIYIYIIRAGKPDHRRASFIRT
jgi:hypothetical protein